MKSPVTFPWQLGLRSCPRVPLHKLRVTRHKRPRRRRQPSFKPTEDLLPRCQRLSPRVLPREHPHFPLWRNVEIVKNLARKVQLPTPSRPHASLAETPPQPEGKKGTPTPLRTAPMKWLIAEVLVRLRLACFASSVVTSYMKSS